MRNNGINKTMCHQSSHADLFELELAAILKSKHGLLAAVCNAEGLDPQRIANALNPTTSHQLTPGEFIRLLVAGTHLGVTPVTSTIDRLIQTLRDAQGDRKPNGVWTDEAHEALHEIADMLRDHPDPKVADLTAGEVSALRAHAMRVRAAMDGLLNEFDFQNGRKG